MPLDLPLDRMTLADKLHAIEALWADLSRQPHALPSPAWHRDVLLDRKRRADAGELKFLDWGTALGSLREELGEHPAP